MNQREYQEILFNSSLPPLQKLLYAYLRSCMDWDSCIVGDAGKKMISYQSIKEHLEYLPAWGSQAQPVDLGRDQIKRLLAGLVKAGYITRLKGLRYGVELRFFLPFASTGQVRPQEERHRSAIPAAPHKSGSIEVDQDPINQGVSAESFDCDEGRSAIGAPYHERHTSLLLLSLSNQYIQYDPDDADWRWINYFLGADVKQQRSVDVGLETEKFNLRCCKNPEYDMTYQREDWRTWILRAVEHERRQR